MILTLTLPDDSEKREISQPRNTMQENLLQKKNDNIISIFTQIDWHYNASTVETVTV